MRKATARETATSSQPAPERRVIIANDPVHGVGNSEGTTMFLRDVQRAVDNLGVSLANIKEVLLEHPAIIEELRHSKNEYINEYIPIATSSIGLPDKKGYYLIQRGDDVTFTPLSIARARAIMREGRIFDVFGVEAEAVERMKEGAPVALQWNFYGNNENEEHYLVTGYLDADSLVLALSGKSSINSLIGSISRDTQRIEDKMTVLQRLLRPTEVEI